MNILSASELKEALESGRVSLGCPLPDGFKRLTDSDKRDLEDAFRKIIALEQESK